MRSLISGRLPVAGPLLLLAAMALAAAAGRRW